MASVPLILMLAKNRFSSSATGIEVQDILPAGVEASEAEDDVGHGDSFAVKTNLCQ